MTVPRVKEIAYEHKTDVDTSRRFDAAVFEEGLGICVSRALEALEMLLPSYDQFKRRNIQYLLTSIKATHLTVRKVLGFGSDTPQAVDALALARLPLEGLFAICLMVDAPEWVDVYVRDD